MIVEDIVKRYIIIDPALYSLWMPGDISAAAIQFTDVELLRTYDYIIEDDEAADVWVPTFADTRSHTAYVNELEFQLKQGLMPKAARDAALRKMRP